MIGTIGNPVVVEEYPKFAIKNVALFKNIGKVSPYFIKYFLESKEVVDQMEKDAKGSTQKFVSSGCTCGGLQCVVHHSGYGFAERHHRAYAAFRHLRKVRCRERNYF